MCFCHGTQIHIWPSSSHLHVILMGMGAFLGGMMTLTPLWRQPRMAPPRASTMNDTRNLERRKIVNESLCLRCVQCRPQQIGEFYAEETVLYWGGTWNGSFFFWRGKRYEQYLLAKDLNLLGISSLFICKILSSPMLKSRHWNKNSGPADPCI